MDKKIVTLRIGSGLLGLVCLIAGGRSVYLGAAGFLGKADASQVNIDVLAALDNEFRFFAGVLALVGLSLVISSAAFFKKPGIAQAGMQIGLEAVFVGGLARAFAFTEYGYSGTFLPPVLVEIIVPAVLFVLLKVAQRNSSETQTAT